MKFLYKTLSILNSIDKKNYLRIQILCLFLVLSLILESLSITLILPVLAFFFSESTPDLGFFNYFLNQNNSLIYALCIFSLMIIVKNLFSIYLGYYRTNFTFNTQIDISKKILDNILSINYDKFISQSSSAYLRNILQEPNNFSSGFLNPLLIIISEIFVLLGVMLIISLIQPKLFIFLFLFSSLILIIFFKIIRNKIRELGQARQDAEFKRIRVINNALDSFQVTKIFNLEKFYISNYNIHSSKVKIAGVINETVANIPRFFLELLMIILIVFIIIYLKSVLKLDNNETLIILSLYGYAAFRIFPSLNRIMVNIQNVQFAISTFNLIYKLILRDKPFIEKKNNIANFDKCLKFSNVNFAYDKSIILDNLNIEIYKNTITGVSGVSGSGKTTLINIISGLLKFDSGEVLIDEKKIDLNKTSIMSLFSYVPQNNLLIDGTIIDNIALGQNHNFITYKKINKILSSLNLQNLIDILPQGLDTNIGKNGSKISGGQAQRICIARALYFERKVIILDEPTSSLDKENEDEFLNYINNLKSLVTIIIVSHKKKSFDICDQVIYLNK